jgi:hypothetical protein
MEVSTAHRQLAMVSYGMTFSIPTPRSLYLTMRDQPLDPRRSQHHLLIPGSSSQSDHLPWDVYPSSRTCLWEGREAIRQQRFKRRALCLRASVAYEGRGFDLFVLYYTASQLVIHELYWRYVIKVEVLHQNVSIYTVLLQRTSWAKQPGGLIFVVAPFYRTVISVASTALTCSDSHRGSRLCPG